MLGENVVASGDYTILRSAVDEFLKHHYKISINDIDRWYGNRLCCYLTTLQGLDFQFIDIEGSDLVNIVSAEINSNFEYYFDNLHFQPGDVIIDIGANIGMVSVLLAKKYPYLKIYSYEPVKVNYDNLVKNIEKNEIPEGTIIPERKAVTGDGKPVTMMFNPTNTGGSTISDVAKLGYIVKDEDKNIESITLDQIFEKHNLKKVKMLKIDCEGAEYEVLKNCSVKNLKKIQYLRGEFHEDANVNPDNKCADLVEYCKKYIPDVYVVNLIK